MKALLPRPSGQWFVLLGGALCLAVAAVPAQADMLVPSFGTQAARGGSAAPVVYRSGQNEASQTEEDTPASAVDSAAAMRVLAMVLVAPAGTQPTGSSSASSSGSSGSSNLSSVVKSPNGSSGTSGNSNSSSTGTSQTSGNGPDPTPHDSPEPASLLLAAVGVILTGWGQRRRRLRVAF
jgi:hypothetical protein